ncbi:MAG: hypothetical protein RL458_3003, partial [Pseudomonadota bacterium]
PSAREYANDQQAGEHEDGQEQRRADHRKADDSGDEFRHRASALHTGLELKAYRLVGVLQEGLLGEGWSSRG